MLIAVVTSFIVLVNGSVCTDDVQFCPPGLCRVNSSCSCNCDHRSYQGVATCDSKFCQSTISPLFWAGYVDEEHIGDDRYFLTGYCPGGFCSSTNTIFSHYEELDEKICRPQSRTGILCGKCINGTSVYSNGYSPRCGKCGNLLQHGKYFGIFQYFMYEIFPLTVFFFLLVLFNFSLTSGPLVGFIFYSQVLHSVAAYNDQFRLNTEYPIPVVLFYSIWNLDFFEFVLPSYCLVENWNAFDVFMFHYVSAVTPLVLIVIVVLMVNYGKLLCLPVHCVRKILDRWIPKPNHSLLNSKQKRFLVNLKNKFFYPDSKLLHGIVAVLVLSYAKFVSLSFILLGPAFSLYLNWPTDIPAEFQRNSLRPFLDGTIPYFGEVHRRYAIPSVIIISLSFIPPTILLIRPFLLRYNRVETVLRRWLPLTKIDLFLNEFYHCYRPKFRWYAGVYFFYRILLFATSVYPLLSQQFAIQQLLCTFFLVVHCIAQPYCKKLYNYIDGILLGVLLCLSCLQEYSFFVSHGIIEEQLQSAYIGFTIACISLIYLVLYMASIIIKHCCSAYHLTYHDVVVETNDNEEGFVNVYFLMESNRNELVAEYKSHDDSGLYSKESSF